MFAGRAVTCSMAEPATTPCKASGDEASWRLRQRSAQRKRPDVLQGVPVTTRSAAGARTIRCWRRRQRPAVRDDGDDTLNGGNGTTRSEEGSATMAVGLHRNDSLTGDTARTRCSARRQRPSAGGLGNDLLRAAPATTASMAKQATTSSPAATARKDARDSVVSGRVMWSTSCSRSTRRGSTRCNRCYLSSSDRAGTWRSPP